MEQACSVSEISVSLLCRYFPKLVLHGACFQDMGIQYHMYGLKHSWPFVSSFDYAFQGKEVFYGGGSYPSASTFLLGFSHMMAFYFLGWID